MGESKTTAPVFGPCDDHMLKHGAEAEALRRGIEEIIANPGKTRGRLVALLDRVDAGESLAWLEERDDLRHQNEDDCDMHNNPHATPEFTVDPTDAAVIAAAEALRGRATVPARDMAPLLVALDDAIDARRRARGT